MVIDRLMGVAISCHNKGETVARAMRSVDNQQGASPEIIVVNDGSSDDSQATIEAVARKSGHPCRLVSFESRQGANAARNAALQAAESEWIQFLDGDDVLLPGALASLQEVIANTEAEAVLSSGYIWNGTRLHRDHSHVLLGLEGRKEIIRNMLRLGVTFSTNGICVKKEVVKHAGLMWDERLQLYQEWDYCLRLLLSDVLLVTDTRPRYVVDNKSGGSVWKSHPTIVSNKLLLTYEKWLEIFEGTDWIDDFGGFEFRVLQKTAQAGSIRQTFRIANRNRRREYVAPLEEWAPGWRRAIVNRAGIFTYATAELVARFGKKVLLRRNTVG